jgi:hypothetical protein
MSPCIRELSENKEIKLKIISEVAVQIYLNGNASSVIILFLL